MEAAVDVTSPTSQQITTTAFNTTLLKTSLGIKTTIVTWLCLFIIVGFVGNCILVITVVQSRRLRTTTIHVVICSMAIVNLLDVVFNSAIILGAIASEKWSFGLLVCELQAGLLLLTTMNMVLHVGVLAADRLLSVVNPKKYLRRRTYIIMCVLVSYSWLHSTAFSLPLMSSAIPSHLNFNRYHCALRETASFGYVSFVLITYIVCLLFILSVGLVVICHVVKSRLQENQNVSYSSQAIPEVKKQFNVSLHFGIIAALWGIFCAPYVFLTYSEHIVSVSHEWQLDVSITWMRLAFPIFLPLVTFICIRDAWIKFKSHLVCRKKNLVTGASASSESTPLGTPLPSPKRAEIKVPVLFATENGLHYQTYDHQGSYIEDFLSEVDPGETQTTELGTARKCDVYGSRDFLQMEDDTSDYSSVKDPFSTSNPISIKDQFAPINGCEDLQSNGIVGHENKPADSGIDSTPGTKEKKKKKRKEKNKIEQQDIQKSPKKDKKKHEESKGDLVEPKSDLANGNKYPASPKIMKKKKQKKNKIVQDVAECPADDHDSEGHHLPPRLEPIELKSERIQLGDMGVVNIISETDIDLPSSQVTPEKNPQTIPKRKKQKSHKHDKDDTDQIQKSPTTEPDNRSKRYADDTSVTPYYDVSDKTEESIVTQDKSQSKAQDTNEQNCNEDGKKLSKRKRRATYVNDIESQAGRRIPKLPKLRCTHLKNDDASLDVEYDVTTA